MNIFPIKTIVICAIFLSILSSQTFETISNKSYGTRIDGDSVNVTFWITVPFWTPQSDTVFIIGSLPSLGNSTDFRAIPFEKVNDVTWIKKIKLPVGVDIAYQYSRGTQNSSSDDEHLINISNNDSIYYDAVVNWNDLDVPIVPNDSFISAAALVDFPVPFVIDSWWDQSGSGEYSSLDTTLITIRDRAGL
ncbi:MAG: carbohydrate-binding module family 20 domain-containing protein, partial [Candidatus Neomarinimicrobiota bacterium]